MSSFLFIQVRFYVMKKLFEMLENICFSVLFITVVMTFFFRVIVVEGNSMNRTLSNGDRVIITNFCYTPQRGDIVVTDKNNYFKTPLIKRVIAIEGDTIKIDYSTGDVYINGEILSEDYIKEKIAISDKETLEITIPDGYVFLMGDNRNQSSDSRESVVGVINEKNIMGKAIFRIMPLEKIGTVWNYVWKFWRSWTKKYK